MAVRVPVLSKRTSKSFNTFQEVQIWSQQKDQTERDVIISLGAMSREISKFTRGSTESVTVGAHASSHLPVSGADRLSTTAPFSVGSANAIGSVNSFVRSDHIHQGVHSVSVGGGTDLFGDVNFIGGTGITGGLSGQNITISVDESDVDHGSLGGLGDDDHTQYLRSNADDSGSGSYTLSNPIPFVFTDASADIETGVTDSVTANRIKFKDRNTNATGKKSFAVDFESGNNDIFSFIVQEFSVAFSTPTDHILTFLASGTGNIKLDSSTGDIELKANAAIDITGAAVWDYQSNTAITLGTSASVDVVYTLAMTGAFAGDFSFDIPQFLGPGKLAFNRTGTFFAGNENFEIEAISGDLFLNAKATGLIHLNEDEANVDTVISSDNIAEIFKVDASEDRAMVEGRDILRYMYTIMASRG